MDAQEGPVELDVIIIGAGISGINSAYRIETQAPAGTTYTILEARDRLGGTWDFFKYPGIRSDSDLHTFGFAWRPWKEDRAIADGASIIKYLKESAAETGIDKKIRYRHNVLAADWSSDALKWTFEVEADGQIKTFRSRFMIIGTGYYDYEEPMAANIPGIENFKGTVVHPQLWPEDLDYSNKEMVIIGSGATAVTLLPVIAKTASKVTMLQRSPTYFISIPTNDLISRFSRWALPSSIGLQFLRMRSLFISYMFFYFSRSFPKLARNMLVGSVKKELPPTILADPYFMPTYNPWEQRLCFCPDGDFFEALRSGKADVVTDHIKTVTDGAILLESGLTLKPDIICTATGLKLRIAGGIRVTVDVEVINPAEKFLWKGVMLQDLPNAAFIIGYTNNSWTLGADAAIQLVARLMNSMKRKGQEAAVPRVENPEEIEPRPFLDLNSTYLQKATHLMPKVGGKGQWSPRTNYFLDLNQAKRGNITTGLEFITARGS